MRRNGSGAGSCTCRCGLTRLAVAQGDGGGGTSPCGIRTMKPIDETDDEARERRMQTARERQARYRAKITTEARARRQAIDQERP